MSSYLGDQSFVHQWFCAVWWQWSYSQTRTQSFLASANLWQSSFVPGWRSYHVGGCSDAAQSSDSTSGRPTLPQGSPHVEWHLTGALQLLDWCWWIPRGQSAQGGWSDTSEVLPTSSPPGNLIGLIRERAQSYIMQYTVHVSQMTVEPDKNWGDNSYSSNSSTYRMYFL